MDPERNEKRSIKKKNTQTFYFRVCGFRFGVFCFCLFSYSTRNMIGFDAIALWAKQKKTKKCESKTIGRPLCDSGNERTWCTAVAPTMQDERVSQNDVDSSS